MQPEGVKLDLSQAVIEDDDSVIETADTSSTSNGENSDNLDVSAAVVDVETAKDAPDKTDTLPPEALVASVIVNEEISQALTERLSDGIVPYTSAHLDGAASETVINGGHSIQENPQTILTLRRILHKQLQQ